MMRKHSCFAPLGGRSRVYRWLVRWLLFCLVISGQAWVVLTAKATRPNSGQPTTETLAVIDRFVEQEMADLRLPGVALGIVQGEKIIHLKGFGHADPRNRLVTPQTPFVLESLSKSFTALAVMQLVEAGKLDLDAPVQRTLPWFAVADPTSSTQMTLRHLLHQTSGLSQLSGTIFEEYSDVSEEALENAVRSLRTVQTRPLDQGYEYSNMNYTILGLIVQTVSGQPYERYVQQHILEPLAMNHSYAALSEARRSGLAHGTKFWFGQPRPVPPDITYNRAAAPEGLISASAEDLTHYLIAQLNGGRYRDAAILSAAGIAILHHPAATQRFSSTYAMGWESTEINGVATITHNGAGTREGFQTRMILIPNGQWGIVVLTNAIDLLHFGRIDGIAIGVMSLLLDRPRPEAPAEPLRWIFFTLLVVGLFQVLGVIRSLWLLRHWRMESAARLAVGSAFLRHVIVPLLCNLTWLGALVGAEFAISGGVAWASLGILTGTDLGWTELLSGGVALLWGCLLRPTLLFLALRQRRVVGNVVTQPA